MANMKKTLEILSMWPEVALLTPLGVEYKSGITEEEVKQKLLQSMFIELRGKEDLNNNAVSPDVVVGVEAAVEGASTVTAQALLHLADGVIPTVITRPTGWYIYGWFAFCMFGPFVVESDRVTIIELCGVDANSNAQCQLLRCACIVKSGYCNNRTITISAVAVAHFRKLMIIE
jgi:hypothetical protein